MEIIAGILIIASVVLPILVSLAVLVWIGMVIYSFVAHLSPEPAPREEEELVAAPAEERIPAAA
jgi:hypothetical protein